MRFDDPSLVANAGLVLVGTLVVRLELEGLVDSLVRVDRQVPTHPYRGGRRCPLTPAWPTDTITSRRANDARWAD